MQTINADLLETIKNHLIETYKPLRIFLFGSYAWGEPNNESDIDIAVIISSTDLNMADRVRQGLSKLWNMPIPIDLLIYTETEIADKMSYHSTLQFKIINSGIKIYEAA